MWIYAQYKPSHLALFAFFNCSVGLLCCCCLFIWRLLPFWATTTFIVFPFSVDIVSISILAANAFSNSSCSMVLGRVSSPKSVHFISWARIFSLFHLAGFCCACVNCVIYNTFRQFRQIDSPLFLGALRLCCCVRHDNNKIITSIYLSIYLYTKHILEAKTIRYSPNANKYWSRQTTIPNALHFSANEFISFKLKAAAAMATATACHTSPSSSLIIS